MIDSNREIALINKIYDLEKELYRLEERSDPTQNMEFLRTGCFGSPVWELSYLSNESKERYIKHLEKRIDRVLWRFRGIMLADDLGLG